jgi:FAD/FMN-containing dehydrogenase
VLGELDARLAADPTVTAHGFFGHLADGNVHVEFVGPEVDDLSLDDVVLEVVAGNGGSVAAEHGIGRLKVSSLHLSRAPQEIAVMRAIKLALDPLGLLNPGVLLPDADDVDDPKRP